MAMASTLEANQFHRKIPIRSQSTSTDAASHVAYQLSLPWPSLHHASSILHGVALEMLSPKSAPTAYMKNPCFVTASVYSKVMIFYKQSSESVTTFKYEPDKRNGYSATRLVNITISSIARLKPGQQILAFYPRFVSSSIFPVRCCRPCFGTAYIGIHKQHAVSFPSVLYSSASLSSTRSSLAFSCCLHQKDRLFFSLRCTQFDSSVSCKSSR